VYATVAVLLIGEAGLTALRLGGLLTMLAVYDWPVLALSLVRGAVAMAQCAAGLMWLNHRPRAPAFARGSLLASASLLVLELGVGLAPRSVFPSYRWVVVGSYWIYALAVIGLIQWLTRSSGPSRTPRSPYRA
jgi:hypothetical protein